MKTGAPSRWPSHCRVYARMKDQRKSLLLAEVAGLSCIAEQTAGRVMRDLRECGLVHISKWKRSLDVGGQPLAMWKFGWGQDAQKPEPLGHKACNLRYWHKRKARVIQEHGEEVWARIRICRKQGGADKIVRSGQTVYERGPA